jgi:predicted DNA-binding protein (MmcQ/YjbR family)
MRNDIHTYCLSLPGASADFPFDSEVEVYRVGNKIFALMGHEEPLFINLKCEPELAQELRRAYEGIKPGYHMNKEHWNSIDLNSDVSLDVLKGLVERSYNLIFAGLPKRLQRQIKP